MISNKNIFRAMCLVICCLALGQAQIYGSNGYTTFMQGNINIMLSVPHDGWLKPTSIPNRTCDPLGNLMRDTNTKNFTLVLVQELSSLLSAQYGFAATPFVVFNNLHRVKMDPNREDTFCCPNNNSESLQAYHDYHSFIQNNYRNDFLINGPKKYKQALLFDIHGQAHPENRVELGYILTIPQLNGVLNNSFKSSIQPLYNAGGYSLEQLIRGNVSFGSYLNKYNLSAIPSASDPRPLTTQYYNGGYITLNHSALADPTTNINCIQSELSSQYRDAFATTAQWFAKALFDFYNAHSFYN